MPKLLVSALTATLTLTAYRAAAPDRGDDPLAAPPSEGATVSLNAASSHPVALAGGDQDVYVHLSIDAAELPASPRPAMNLALVIDRSGSMASEHKLEFAKSAAQQLVGRLEPDDRLAIIAYDDEVRTVVPSTAASERDAFVSAIDALHSGNSTNLHGGLMAGYEEVLSHFDEERANRVLLLSDGLANVGVTDPAEIRSRAERCRAKGVRISTMGMGLAYDEELMNGIAQGAGGNYYYVDRAESVGRHLDREIDELSKLVAVDVAVRVELGEGVELLDVYGYPRREKEGRVRVPVKDLYSGEHKKAVLRLRVRGEVGEERTLATASLCYRDVASQERHRTEPARLGVRFTDDVLEVEANERIDVLVQSEIVHNAEAMLAAMKRQKQGNFEGARGLLEARYRNSKLVNDTEYHSAELTKMLSRMHQALLDLERTWDDAVSRRDYQLSTQLSALGYCSD